jgi:hypothetical protein
MPWREGRLDLEKTLSSERGAERRRRIWLTLALAAVALVLLGVLARSLRPK